MSDDRDDLRVIVTRFSQAGRLVLFYARQEVSFNGGAAIEPEHLALAVLRADKRLIVEHLKPEWTLETLKSELKRQLISDGRRLPETAELPFSPSARALIVQAAETADRFGDSVIEPTHLVAVLLQDQTSSAGRVLREGGLSADTILAELGRRETP